MAEEFADQVTSEELNAVVTQLRSIPAATPSEEMTRQLIENLRPHVPKRRFRQQLQESSQPVPNRAAALLAAVTPQIHLLGRAFWIASAAIALILQLVAWLATSDFGFAVVVTAPVLAIGGISFALRGRRTGFGEAEQACPVDPITLTFARFIVVAVQEILIIGTVSLLSSIVQREFTLGPFLLAWLSPFLAFSALSLLIAVRWDGVTASVIGLGLWALLVGNRLYPVTVDFLALPDSPGWLTGKVILLSVTGLCCLLLSRRTVWQNYLEA